MVKVDSKSRNLNIRFFSCNDRYVPLILLVAYVNYHAWLNLLERVEEPGRRLLKQSFVLEYFSFIQRLVKIELIRSFGNEKNVGRKFIIDSVNLILSNFTDYIVIAQLRHFSYFPSKILKRLELIDLYSVSSKFNILVGRSCSSNQIDIERGVLISR
jgi:hypothetical protein